MKGVYLEITNSCNLNCSFCSEEKGNRFIPIEKMDKYLDSIKEVSNYIYLHVLGEPLLHKDFDSIMDLLDEKNFNLQLVTNGILLDKHLDILNHKSLRKLSISLHSISNINVNDDYFRTIDYLIEHNNNKIIELRFYDLNNLDDKLHEYLNKLENKYHFKDTKKDNSYKLKDNVYIYIQEMFTWPNINNPYIGDIGYCHGLKDQVAILSNGKVTSCCLDSKSINSFGDLNENNLKDILNSDYYKDALNNLNNKKLIMPLCKHCSYRLRFSK